MAKKPIQMELKKVSSQKWPNLVNWVFWTKPYQLLDVLRNASRIIVEKRHFQLQQAIHEICFLPHLHQKRLFCIEKVTF